MVKKGLMIVLSSPSGGGKTTLAERLLKQEKNLIRSVSCTTRKPRPGEKSGKAYFFVSEKRFRYEMKKNGFLEWAKVHGHYYGTPKRWVGQQLRRGKDVLFVIDVQGGAALKRQDAGALLIFVNPPTLRALRDRLLKRGDNSPRDLALRLKNAKSEIKQGRQYDYRVVNDQIPRAVREIRGILRLVRQARARVWTLGAD